MKLYLLLLVLYIKFTMISILFQNLNSNNLNLVINCSQNNYLNKQLFDIILLFYCFM